ncbi:RNA polymerase sigma factor SigJ [Actinoallomurus sp. NBC_01490]|uniref:RNA polymerase sigma factor SigJ n=1 Tax=Actinoallomurus sp. NBC_01490 TaxID=2903557 RepID=UPI002E30C71A|nr:RNA polymerase sigma factor SigJ [Actinoallomurus sp. NBC_01490]
MNPSSGANRPGTTPAEPGDAATGMFVDHRELLFSVVYNMLGTVADTEDVLQETWLAWSRAWPSPSISSPRAYLVRIAVNQALARQATISRRRESYVGPWLPEPLVTDTAEDAAEQTVRGESVSLAMLVVLETLTPLERAVFVLHEVFGYAHTEIAEILDRSPSAVRQLAHRARSHVQARRPRYQTDPQVQRQVTERFVAAAFGGDIGALMELLAPDVTMWTDGGGKVGGLRPIQGREKVARLIANVTSRLPEDLAVRYRAVNGDPSAVVFNEHSPFAVMVLDLAPGDDRVRGIYGVTNPDKLAHIDED